MDELAAVLGADPPRAGLLTDFDGTLAEIVPDPAAARPVEGAVEVLGELAGKLGLVGVVSGRGLEDLVSRLEAPPGVVLSASYGREGVSATGRPSATDWADIAHEATGALSGLRGVSVEVKPHGVALHFRRAPEAADAVGAEAASLAGRHGLEVRPGKLVAELTEPGPGKAEALEALVSGRELTAFAFAGDDVADLEAFRHARTLGARCLLVAVVSAESPPGLASAADIVLDGPDALVDRLRGLAGSI